MKNRLYFVFSILFCIATLFMGVGYASINSISLNVNGKMTVQVQDGVFITDVEYVQRENALSNENASVNYTSGTILNSTINLEPNNELSEVSLKISFYNSTDYSYMLDNVIYDESLLSEIQEIYSNLNISYSFTSQNEVIYSNGGTLDVTITFKYKNIDDQTSNVLNSILNFEFVRCYNVTYKNIDNNGYPTMIKEGTDLNITFIDDLPDGVLLSGAHTYSYSNYNLIITDIMCDITISDAVVFEHKDEFVFNGSNYIDTGVYLFNEENYDKNFEVTFSIVNQDSSQESYATLFNALNESDKYFRGVIFRIDYYAKTYDFISDDEGPNETLDHKNIVYQFGKISDVKIYRIDGVIYISVDGGSLTMLRDYSNFNAYFDIPVFFGASLDSSGNAFRHYKGTLSNMRIKMLANDGIQEFEF